MATATVSAAERTDERRRPATPVMTAERRLVATGVPQALVWAAAAILAILSATLAAGAFLRDASPDKAWAVSPADGFAPANLAQQRLREIRPDKNIVLTPAQAREQIALAGLSRRREPLWARPLALLGMAAERRGDLRTARALMEAARGLSRRDSAVNAWFVADASRRGDLDAAVASIGRSILTEPSTAALYLPQLAATLADASTVPVFARILRPRPAWEELFWREAAVNAAALHNAGELRARLHRATPGDLPINRALLLQLTGGGDLDAAERLYRSIVPPVHGDAPIVRDGAFRARPSLPPFDWDEIAGGDQTGTIDPAGGRLLIDGVGGAGGPVARQLVHLPAGRYRLSAERAPSGSDGAAATATVDLACAAGGGPIVALTLDAPRGARDFASDGRCGPLWLTVRAVPGDAPDGYEIALRRVAIERLPGG